MANQTAKMSVSRKLWVAETTTATLVGKIQELQTKVAEQDAEIHRLRLKLAGIDRHGSQKIIDAGGIVAEDREAVLDLSNPNGEWTPVEMTPEG